MALQDNFRKAMRSYVYSVSILSNTNENNECHAITVSSVTSVSIDPPSLLVCINKSASIHNSIIIGSKFCINLLTKDHEELSNICSSYENENKRFESDEWGRKPGTLAFAKLLAKSNLRSFRPVIELNAV